MVDPRTSSKVTAPDLLAAFQEGTGRESEDSGEVEARFYVILFDPLKKPVAKGSFRQKNIEEMLKFVSNHLFVPGRAAAIVLQVDEPEGWEQLAVSAPED